MENKLHKNYKIASKLIFLILCLDIIELFFSYSSLSGSNKLGFVAVGIVFTLFTAYVIWRGVNWVKYIMLILVLLSVAGIALSIMGGIGSARSLSINALQVIIMIVTTVLLYRIPADIEEEPLDSDI